MINGRKTDSKCKWKPCLHTIRAFISKAFNFSSADRLYSSGSTKASRLFILKTIYSVRVPNNTETSSNYILTVAGMCVRLFRYQRIWKKHCVHSRGFEKYAFQNYSCFNVILHQRRKTPQHHWVLFFSCSLLLFMIAKSCLESELQTLELQFIMFNRLLEWHFFI